MAHYTVELGTLVEANFDLGLKDYPIYKEELRKPLNDLIIEHFYFREIGLETPQLFKRFLNRKMMEIMPYYNQLLKSEDLEFNPLYNIDLTETFEQEGTAKANGSLKGKVTNQTSDTVTGDATTNTMSKNEDISVSDDSPSSKMTIEDIRNNKYANKVEKVNNENTVDEKVATKNTSTKNDNQDLENVSSNNQDTKQNYVRKTEGSSAGLSFSRAIAQWRDIMINVNVQILEELEPLFMQLF